MSAPAPLNEFTSLLYDELHRLASRYLRSERSGHTLQTTALVHEAWLRLASRPGTPFADRNHFLATAARVMRQVLVDYARARLTQKRGPAPETLDETAVSAPGADSPEPWQLLELDRALNALAEEDEWLARLVELRYFAGLTAEETADLTAVSVHAIRHDLRLAQAWLKRSLK
jgi:RNA polymerase sigma factor (TIGR02999 family)